MSEFPRRCRLDQNTPTEMLIRECVQEVEMHGAHPLLTECVNLLQSARERLADWIDAPRCEWGTWVSSQVVSCRQCHRVQNAWNKSEPCNGPVKIALREVKPEE